MCSETHTDQRHCVDTSQDGEKPPVDTPHGMLFEERVNTPIFQRHTLAVDVCLLVRLGDGI